MGAAGWLAGICIAAFSAVGQKILQKRLMAGAARAARLG